MIPKNDKREDDDATNVLHGQEQIEDPRLLAAVEEYLLAVEAGRRPNRQELLARHPDIADELSACIQSLAFVQSAAAQLNGDSGGGPASDLGVDLSAAQPLGDFKLVREIGRGGMGVVYEAVQLSLGRRVAVKVLSLASALDSKHLQRFRNEAQAAAQLHHTNIVPVYAVGCERSVHFYAMQLIEGQSLADIIRELRRLAGRSAPVSDASGHDTTVPWIPMRPRHQAPRDEASGSSVVRSPKKKPDTSALLQTENSLTSLHSTKRSRYFQNVARLGLQAAEGLDYAHRQGVVHRDIKPGNLLLDATGNLWITDFGLVQLYTDSDLTQTGDLVGTFRYMSPEQASGRAVVLDQRTDIYSLGVTLYELLTLERALPGETREQLLYQIGFHEPRPPRSIDKAIPPELEIILAKATAKDPIERYANARALADDLQRFLADQPILARPPSLWNKAAKFGRRHKPLVLSAVAMLLLVAVGLLASTIRISREQAKTQAAYMRERDRATEANLARASAEKSFEQAREEVDFFARVAAEEMANKPEYTELRKELLEAALVYYQGFLDQRKNDPSIGAELTAASSKVSAILTELSAVDDFFRVDSRAMLVAVPAVQDELHLSAAQIDKIQQFNLDSPRKGGWLGELRQLPTDQKRAKLAAMAADVESKLNLILTAQQLERLRQIALQAGGPRSFSDPAVTEALSLTREQKDKIRAIRSDYDDKRHRRGPFGDPGGPTEHNQDDAVREILAQLTPAQAQTWQTMTGDPVPAAISSRGHGPPSHRP